MDRLQAVLEASPNAVLVVDTSGRIQRANRNVPAVLGYEPDEIEGMVVEELLREEDRTHHVEYREEYMQDPRPRPMGRELDLYALRQSGEEIPVELSLGPIRQNGELHVVATIADISKRKERERELQRQNECLDEFASVVSHDLRNPLSVARGRLELAREEPNEEHFDAIARSHERMDALIIELLTLARQGKEVSDNEPVELSHLTEQCWANVATGEATLRTEMKRLIQAERSRLQQLFENLMRNAVEHGGNAVTVSVGGLTEGFYVEDDGPGIPEDERDEVLEQGYTTAEDGTGFGLSIVRQIVDAHGWDIDVTESDDGGARFEISGVEFAA